MNTIITTATNNALVAAHIETITRKTGSALMGTSKARVTKLNAQKEDVMMRYGLGELPGEVYRLTIEGLTKRISEAEAQLKDAENYSSNFSISVESVVAIACALRCLWSNGDFEMRQEVQKMAFPEGIVWNRENDNYLTPKENLALVAFHSISDSYKNSKTKKEDKSFDLSSVVEHHLKLSNRFIADFKKIVAFIDWCRYKHLLVP